MAAFAVAYLVQAWTIPLDPWSAGEVVNARTLPLGYGIGLLLVSLALLVKRRPIDASPGAHWPTLFLHCVAIAGFGMLIRFAGLWVATATLLLATLLIAGERRVLVLLAAPVGTALTAWFLIAVVLDVYIDPGIWFS